MNRWAFLTALVVVTGAVGAFAIYTFGWRDDGSGSERTARAYAEAIAAKCDPQACLVRSLTRIKGDDWKVVLRDPSDGQIACALLQTDRFAERASGDFAGASQMKCPEARAGTQTNGVAAIGPNWWTETQAEDRLDHSKWAFDAGVSGAVFSCIGQGPTRTDDSGDSVYRRFACTYESGGPRLNAR